MEKFTAGSGYETILQARDISRTTVKSITLNWKEYSTMTNLPKQGCLLNLTWHTLNRSSK